MRTFDVVLLTDCRYANPEESNQYIDNVLLEDGLVAKALEAQGLKVARKSWDDKDFDWSSTQYALFRTTWDYFDRFPEFEQWLNMVVTKTQLINSKRLIYWNIDKHYLQDIEKAGNRIPKTIFIKEGDARKLGAIWKKAKEQHQFYGDEMILKPCISGGARHTYKIHTSELETYETRFQDLIKHEAFMLQEFQEHIVSEGEISLMVFDGKFSHAILKKAKSGDFRVQDDYGGSVHDYYPSDEEIQFAEKVVHSCPEIPIYARVDICKNNNGEWVLVELELIEPELWFRHHPKAAELLAKSIKNNYFNETTV